MTVKLVCFKDDGRSLRTLTFRTKTTDASGQLYDAISSSLSKWQAWRGNGGGAWDKAQSKAAESVSNVGVGVQRVGANGKRKKKLFGRRLETMDEGIEEE